MTTKTKPNGSSVSEAKPQNTQVVLAVPTSALAHLETLAGQYSLSQVSTRGRFERAVMLAQGLQELRRAVQPMLEHIIPLMGSPLGFLTDRDRSPDKPPYGPDVVRDCLIEAVLRGVFPVDNEFNIISARCYITKNGYARLVRELPNLTDLKLMPGVPQLRNGGAIAPFEATWKLGGKADSLKREFAVKVNSQMGADAIIGKATRKMLAAVHAQVTGSTHSLEDAEEQEALGADRALPQATGSRAQQVLSRLPGPQPSPEPATPAQNARLAQLLSEWTQDEIAIWSQELGIQHPQDPTRAEAARMIQSLEAQADPDAEAERRAIEQDS